MGLVAYECQGAGHPYPKSGYLFIWKYISDLSYERRNHLFGQPLGIREGVSEDAGFDVLSTEDALKNINHGKEVHNSMRQDADPCVLSSLYDICHEKAAGKDGDQIPFPEDVKQCE
jgi:hypothetical protein